MSMLQLPDLGEGLHEAEIVSWHVSVGDHVVTDQPLVSVETDKAVVEIPSPVSARVARLVGNPGDRIAVGDTGTVVGELDSTQGSPVSPKTKSPGLGRATPAVRALARERGVNLAFVRGTGPQGVVTKHDVERAADLLASSAPAEPVTGVRRAMVARMSKAHAAVPRATVTDEADVTAWSDGTSFMLRLIRAIAAACQAVPALNVWFDPDTMTRRLHKTVDLGIAVETDVGLFVPILRDVGNRRTDDLQEGLDRLKHDVRTRTVRQADLTGQTITLSNFGAIGGMFAELIVVPPQVAIVGAGRSRWQTLMIDERPTARRMLPLSVTFDHRAVTGAEATRFLGAAVADLEK